MKTNLQNPKSFALEGREAFGVRGACSRFRGAMPVQQREQAPRTPNASRGPQARASHCPAVRHPWINLPCYFAMLFLTASSAFAQLNDSWFRVSGGGGA